MCFWFPICDDSTYPQMCPEIQPPATYWAEDDERAIAAHKGILYRIIIDGNPFNIVRN